MARLVTVALAGLLLTGPGGLGSLVLPFTLPAGSPELHRWHGVDLAALVSLIVAGGLLLTAWRPRGSAALAQTAIAGALLITGSLLALPPHLTVAAPVGVLVTVLVVAVHPDRRELRSLAPTHDRSRVALVTSVAVAPWLLLNLVDNVGLQLADTSEHAVFGHWAGAAALAATLLVAGALTALGRPGWRWLAGLLAATYAFVGLGAILLDRYDGSWGVEGGVVALAAAVGYAVAAARGRVRGA